MLLVAGALVGLDRAIEKIQVAVLDAGKGTLHRDKSCAQGFDLRSFQLNARFEFFENIVVPKGFPVGCDFGGHESGFGPPDADQIASASSGATTNFP